MIEGRSFHTSIVRVCVCVNSHSYTALIQHPAAVSIPLICGHGIYLPKHTHTHTLSFLPPNSAHRDGCPFIRWVFVHVCVSVSPRRNRAVKIGKNTHTQKLHPGFKGRIIWASLRANVVLYILPVNVLVKHDERLRRRFTGLTVEQLRTSHLQRSTLRRRS